MRRALACVAALLFVAFLSAGCGRERSAANANGGSGTLDVGDVGAQLRLVSDAGKRELEGEGGRWSLAPGTCRAESIILSRKDKDGNNWYIFASAKNTPAGEFRIVAGQVTRLKLGPPIILAAPMTVKDGEAKISLQLTGQGGEHYGAARVVNENLKGAPNIKISNELGEVLESGQFRYG